MGDSFYTLTLTLNDLATRLFIEPDDIPTIFRDGRAMAPYAKQWVRQAYPTLKKARVLTSNGVRFQASCKIGSGRDTKPKDLRQALTQNHFVVMDITALPLLRFCPTDQACLLELEESGVLTKKGLSMGEFYELAIGCPPDEIAWERYPLT